MPERLSVEVVYALPDKVFLRRLELPAGATVADAIAESAVCETCIELREAPLRAGIFSKAVKLERKLENGDRVELYRPLQLDPMEARRRRASRRSPS